MQPIVARNGDGLGHAVGFFVRERFMHVINPILLLALKSLNWAGRPFLRSSFTGEDASRAGRHLFV